MKQINLASCEALADFLLRRTFACCLCIQMEGIACASDLDSAAHGVLLRFGGESALFGLDILLFKQNCGQGLYLLFQSLR
jgi:hypothetical protein